MKTLKASDKGLEMIHQLRRKKGWNRLEEEWYTEAQVSKETLKRFLKPIAIKDDNFISICNAIGADWKKIAENTSDVSIKKNQSWKDASDSPAFYGRTEELKTLTEWIVDSRCRLVAILGGPGIGKTSLSVKLGIQVVDEFEYFVWRTLNDGPHLQEILEGVLRELDTEQNIDLPNNANGLISQLLSVFRQHRVLLIFDAWENVLGGEPAGFYKAGYENYGELLRRIGEESHKSCLAIASQEKPEEVVLLTRKALPVKLLTLKGLDEAAAIKILKEDNLHFTDEDAARLIQMYSGNPQALIHICKMIQELFHGSITEFFRINTMVGVMSLEKVIKERFKRISECETKILCCLARESKPIDLENLQLQTSSEMSKSEFVESLQSLERRCLIEKISQETKFLFTLQPLIKKYANKHLCISQNSL